MSRTKRACQKRREARMGEKRTVMVVDDEAHIRMVLATLLKGMGVVVAGEAGNGATAVEMYRQHRPDLVLMDVNMPVKTGDAALKEIMAEDPAARVVMLTSMADMGTVEACLKAGAYNYVRKDSPLDEIRAAVKEALA